MIPSTRIIKFQSKTPEVNASFVAQSATILGNVKIGLKSSIWYGAVIRGMVIFVLSNTIFYILLYVIYCFHAI